MIVQRQSPALKFLPVQVFIALPLHFHGNAVVNRTYELAEVAANTIFFLDSVSVIWFAVCERNGLMGSVLAGNVTKSTVDAFVLVYFGYMMIIDIQILPVC